MERKRECWKFLKRGRGLERRWGRKKGSVESRRREMKKRREKGRALGRRREIEWSEARKGEC
jgi:hypothetical protein